MAQTSEINTVLGKIENGFLGNKIIISMPDEGIEYNIFVDKNGNVAFYDHVRKFPVKLIINGNMYELLVDYDVFVKSKMEEEDKAANESMLLNLAMVDGTFGSAIFDESTILSNKLILIDNNEMNMKYEIIHSNYQLISVILGSTWDKEDDFTKLEYSYELWDWAIGKDILSMIPSYIGIIESNYDKNPLEFSWNEFIFSEDNKVIRAKTFDYSNRYGQYEWDGNVVEIGASTMKKIKVTNENVGNSLFKNRRIEHTQKHTIMRGIDRGSDMVITYKSNGDIVLYGRSLKKTINQKQPL
ncbi:MAG: hypothetical protein L3J29_04780 [Cyclobacteriaceae bacterium]|nr:hypothetical protein [Cyclobacteriaceae bacterium]